MKNIAILTPSFLPDFEGLKRLHESVVRFTEPSTIHHVIVPRRDLAQFRKIRSARMRLWAEEDFLPRGFVSTGGLSAIGRRMRIIPHTFNCSAVNLRRPWLPLRGWILQQILKLSAATRLGADAVVIVDSDVVLIRPMSAEMFFRGESVRFYELKGAVTPEMSRHFAWTRTAHELLGIPWDKEGSFSDFVGGVVSWDPAIVSACLKRIEEVKGTSWAVALSGKLHFSEFILYGIFVRNFGTEQQRAFEASHTLCHSYWSPTPLTGEGAEKFVSQYDERDVAVHIQSNSGTPRQIVDGVVASLTSGRTS